MINDDIKIQALSEYLDTDADDVYKMSNNYYDVDGAEYLVLTDDEADNAVKEYIKGSVWAFNASFCSSFTGLPEDMFTAIQDKCEDANDAILQCIEQSGGLDSFVEEAVSCDGRGYFLSGYDGEEREHCVNGEYIYIYRTN